MDATGYRVVFAGEIAEGESPETVKGRLQETFKKDRKRVERLFSGRAHVIRTAKSLHEAKRCVSALAHTGAICRIEPVGAPTNDGDAKPASAADEEIGAGAIPRPGFFHRLRLAFAATELALLAASYLVLTAVVAGLGLYHGLAETWADRYISIAPLAWLANTSIALLCFALALLLVRPLLPRMEPRERLALDPKYEPDLFALVDTVCEFVGAPTPGTVTVSCRPSVSATYQRPQDFFAGKVSLDLGLLAGAGMNVGDLGALIAREMSRFARHSGVRRTYLVGFIPDWFARMEANPDRIEQTLSALARNPHPLVRRIVSAIAPWAAKGRTPVSPWRRAAAVVSARPRRALEARLDRTAQLIVGEAQFTALAEHARRLARAAETADSRSQAKWRRDHQLIDDLPALAAHTVSTPGNGKGATAGNDALSEESIVPVALACDAPAGSLFSSFQTLCRRTTFLHYRNRLALPVTGDRLLPVPAKDASNEQASHKILRHYFLGTLRPALVTLPLETPRGLTAAEALNAWKQAHAALRRSEAAAGTAYRAYAEADRTLIGLLQREALLRAGLRGVLRGMGISRAPLEEIQVRCRTQEGRHADALKHLATVARAGLKRLGAALALLELPETKKHLPRREALASQAGKTSALLARIEPLQPRLEELRLHAIMLEVLLSHAAAHNKDALRDRIREHAADIRQLLTALRLALRDPAAMDGNNTPAVRPLGADLDDADPSHLLDLAYATLATLAAIREKALARLAATALQVERAWGLA